MGISQKCLQDVVVIGYGKYVTGAVSSFRANFERWQMYTAEIKDHKNSNE